MPRACIDSILSAARCSAEPLSARAVSTLSASVSSAEAAPSRVFSISVEALSAAFWPAASMRSATSCSFAEAGVSGVRGSLSLNIWISLSEGG